MVSRQLSCASGRVAGSAGGADLGVVAVLMSQDERRSTSTLHVARCCSTCSSAGAACGSVCDGPDDGPRIIWRSKASA